jgi:thioredoxin 1
LIIPGSCAIKLFSKFILGGTDMRECSCKVTDADFGEKVLNSAKPAVVNFWAICSPCRAFAAEFEEWAESFRGRVNFFKLNTDANKTSCYRFNVFSVPTIIFFENGVEVKRAVGILEARTLLKTLFNQFNEERFYEDFGN